MRMAGVDRAREDWTVTPARARWCFWLVAACSFLIVPLGAFCWNHATQIPLVNALNDGALYPNDPFMAALARYPSVLWPLVALLVRVFPLEGTLLVLFGLSRLFALYAAGRLARAIAPGSGLAQVGASALFAFPLGSMLGNGTIVGVCLEQSSLAIPCFLLAAAAFHERRPVAWAVWLGAGFGLTSLYGTFAVSYFGAVFLFDPDYGRAWKRWARALPFFLALASYEIYMSAVAARGASSDEASWLVAARTRGWTHLYPLTWGWDAYAQFGASVALFAILIALVRRDAPRVFRHGVVWSAVAGLWLLDAFVAAYVLQSRPLMMMQPARATDLFLSFAGIAMVAVASRRLDRGQDSRATRWGLASLGASFLVWRVPGALVVAALLLVAAVPAVWRRIAPWISPRRLAVALVAWVALVGIAEARERWSETNDLRDVVFRGPEIPARQLAAWAKKNTTRDAVFLLNPSRDEDLDQFTGLAERSIFTSVERGTALFWAPEFVPEWLGRLEALDVTPEYRGPWSLDDDFDAAFRDLDDDHVLRLKERYHVTYWVVPPQHPSRFPVAWQNEVYKVLAVSDAGAVPDTTENRSVCSDPVARTQLSRCFPHLFIHDTALLFTAPARWNARDWQLVTAGVLGVAGLVAVDDDLRTAVRRSGPGFQDDIASTFQPFGTWASFAVIGGFYFGGLAAHDQKARGVASDAVVASILSGVVIAPTLKWIFGRSRPRDNQGSRDFKPFTNGPA
jgi:hypothetical protein